MVHFVPGTCGGGLSWHIQWAQGRSCEGASPLPLSSASEEEQSIHYHVAVIINYLGHCISLVALLVAFVLFLRLR